MHIHQENILDIGQYYSLIEDGFHAPFRYNSCFGHFLHGIELVILLHLHFPHLPEATLSYAFNEVEVVFLDNDRLL